MIEKAVLSKNLWSTPFLPPIPETVKGIDCCSKVLSNRTPGEWQIFAEEIKEIPSPYDQNQNYDFSKIDDVKWKDAVVPSSLIMQGFDVKNNVEYYYRRTVSLPQAVGDNRAFIRFEGVYCNARIWINNTYVSTHIGGFAPFDVEVTDFVKGENDTFELIVGVSDIEGKNIGTWNKNGEAMSDASWASYYAHHNVCGILRNVTLYYLPQNFIVSKHTETRLSENKKDATVDVDLVLSSKSGDNKIRLVLTDSKGKSVFDESVSVDKSYLSGSNPINRKNAVECSEEFKKKHPKSYATDLAYSKKYVAFEPCKLNDGLYACRIRFEVKDAELWTAETPNLYLLSITLTVDCAEVQSNQDKIGLRQIEYGGSGGTDKNKVYVNGREIKLKGVCRHDVSHLYGRSITREDAYSEILAYKNNNINFIRTSHYPASQDLIDACNELGMYVEQENAVCFKGSNNYELLCSPDQIMQNLSETVEFYKDNPSIVMWSIANESGFEKSMAFRKSYEYIKQADKTRPVIFSYPFTVSSDPAPYDIFSKHYQKVYTNLGDEKLPKLHDEFAHVACYNLYDLVKDNNFRLAWGESIQIGWENIINGDGALGCAIWCAIDDVFYIPQGTQSSHQRHTSGRAIGYGEWGSVLDAFKREKPEAYLTKKAFSPIRVESVAARSGSLQLQLKNWFDHLDLNSIRLEVKNRQGTLLFDGKISASISPKTTGSFEIPLKGGNCDYLDIAFYQDDYLVEQMIEEKEARQLPKVEAAVSATVTEYKGSVEYACRNKKISVDKKDCIVGVFENGKLLANDLSLYFNGKKAVGKSKKITKLDVQKDKIELQIKETFQFFQSARYRFSVQDGKVRVRLRPGFWMKKMIYNNLGVVFELNKNISDVSWEKNCKYSYYPQNHLERSSGRAFVKAAEVTPYGEKPQNEWKDDVINYFFVDANEMSPLQISNDFKTTRTDVSKYQVAFGDKATLDIVKTSGQINCFTQIEKVKNVIGCADKEFKKDGNWHLRRKNTKKAHIKSKTVGSSVSVSFFGDGVNILGTRAKTQGDISLYLDGKFYQKVSTKSDICASLNFMVIASIPDLRMGEHTLTIKIEDNCGAKIAAIEVCNSKEIKTYAQLLVTKGHYYKSLGWGNYCGTRLNAKEKNEVEFEIEL